MIVNAQTVFDKASKKYNIDKKILASVSHHESTFYPNVVSINVRSDKKKVIHFLKACHYDYKSHKKNITIFLRSKDNKIYFFSVLNILKLNYDVGIMQINSYNIKKKNLNAVKLVDNVSYNIEQGAKILKSCLNHYPNRINFAFECYNKGYNKKRYNNSYYNGVLRSYATLFIVE